MINYLHQCNAVVQKRNFLVLLGQTCVIFNANLTPYFAETSTSYDVIWDKYSEQQHQHQSFKMHPINAPLAVNFLSK